MLTQKRLKEVVDYDPDTGIFTRKQSVGRAVAGSPAGTKKANGYVSIVIDRQQYLAHRLAFLYMTGSMPPLDVDHKNNNRSDNRWENLREATRAQNMHNVKNRKGFSLCKQTNKFAVSIKNDGKKIWIGRFDTEESARLAYEDAVKRIHGQFASV